MTEDGISVVELGASAGPRVSKNVIITDDPTENADTRDVSLTPSGSLAVVRREGAATVAVVDLATGVRTTLTLSGPVTDLDLTSDGKRAVAVVRATAEVAIIPLDGALPTDGAITRVTIAGEIVGSVALAPGGSTALLYSNATTLERLTVLTLAATPSYRVDQAARARAVGVPGRGRRERGGAARRRNAPAAPAAAAGSGGSVGSPADGGVRADAGVAARHRRAPGARSAWSRSPRICRPGSRPPTRRPRRWCCRRPAIAR